jgi:hypothetical protein
MKNFLIAILWAVLGAALPAAADPATNALPEPAAGEAAAVANDAEADLASEPAGMKADEAAADDEAAGPVEGGEDSDIPSGGRPWPAGEDPQRLEAQIGLLLALPQDSGWDPAPGAEIKVRRWWENGWGIGGALGYSVFSYSDSSLQLTPNVVTPLKADGDVTLIPVTLLVARRFDLKSGRQAVVEGGVRYVFVDSEIEVSTRYVNHYGQDVTYSSFAESEDQLLFVLGAEWRGRFGRDRFWLAGVEYQASLTDPDPDWLDEDLGNDFAALVLKAGVGRTW